MGAKSHIAKWGTAWPSGSPKPIAEQWVFVKGLLLK